jgi:hypothetical protein
MLLIYKPSFSVNDQYNLQWLSEISNSSKLETYKLIKDSFDFENYLSLVKIQSLE